MERHLQVCVHSEVEKIASSTEKKHPGSYLAPVMVERMSYMSKELAPGSHQRKCMSDEEITTGN